MEAAGGHPLHWRQAETAVQVAPSAEAMEPVAAGPSAPRSAEPPDQIAELLRIIGGSHAQAGMRALCFRLA